MDTFQQRTLWITALLLSLWGFYLAQDALLSVCFGFVFASAMMPAVEGLDRNLPRWLSVLLVFMMFVLILLLVIVPTALLAFQQLQGLLESMPSLLDRLKEVEAGWSHWVDRYPILKNLDVNLILEHVGSQGSVVFFGFTGATMALSKVALNTLTALIISYFFLLDREKIQNYLLRLVPHQEHDWMRHLVDDLLRNTGAFVNGQLLFMATFSGLVYLGLNALNVPYSLLFALIAGLSTLIPIFGPVLVMLVNVVFTWFQTGDGGLAIWVMGIYALVQLIENNVVGPLIMGKAVGLHPLAIILSIMIGGVLLGLPGIILAIPLASSVKILLEAQAIQKLLPHTSSQQT